MFVTSISKVKILAFAVVALAVSTTASAQLDPLDKQIFETAGQEFNVDPLLLYSIAIVESAAEIPSKKGYVKPSPWTLRTEKPFYATNRREAEIELVRLLKTTNSVDVGMMQINTRWHGHRVSHPVDLLDPLTNVRVAAQILSEQIDRYPNDAAMAVGKYHTSDPERAQWYARHVLRVYTFIKRFEDSK